MVIRPQAPIISIGHCGLCRTLPVVPRSQNEAVSVRIGRPWSRGASVPHFGAAPVKRDWAFELVNMFTSLVDSCEHVHNIADRPEGRNRENHDRTWTGRFRPCRTRNRDH
jgi:hypothetical protein